MKTKTFIKTFFLFLILAACSGSDDDNNNIQASIVGKWKITAYQEAGFTLDACEMMEKREFTTDGKTIQTYFYGSNCNTQGVNTNWRYTIENNKLLTRELGGGLNPTKDYIINYNIISLTNNKLIIEGYFVDEGVNGEIPTEIPQSERFTETWERIN
jgi:hypothetical protein